LIGWFGWCTRAALDRGVVTEPAANQIASPELVADLDDQVIVVLRLLNGALSRRDD
jgi:hypothetical protein